MTDLAYDADFLCEGCGERDGTRYTEDDVWLCDDCYETALELTMDDLDDE